MAGIDDVFTSLFIGGGSWLGLLLMLILIVGLTMAWKYMGILTLPVCILFAITVYFDNGLGWHGLIMCIAAIFIIGKLGYEAKRG